MSFLYATVAGAMILGAAAIQLPTTVVHVPEGYADPGNKIEYWMERMYNNVGGHCCGASEAHIMENAKIRSAEKGVMEVLIDGNWIPFTDDQMVTNPGGDPNPTGQTVVWYKADRTIPPPFIKLYCVSFGYQI